MVAHVGKEIFIRYLTEQAYNVVKSERKPRRNIAYKDMGELSSPFAHCRSVDRSKPLPFLESTISSFLQM